MAEEEDEEDRAGDEAEEEEGDGGSRVEEGHRRSDAFDWIFGSRQGDES